MLGLLHFERDRVLAARRAVGGAADHNLEGAARWLPLEVAAEHPELAGDVDGERDHLLLARLEQHAGGEGRQ